METPAPEHLSVLKGTKMKQYGEIFQQDLINCTTWEIILNARTPNQS